MQRTELQYEYPEALIATEPAANYRIAHLNGSGVPAELTIADLWRLFNPGDVLVINDSKVEARRVFTDDLEILFLNPVGEMNWEVLFPARSYQLGETIALPGGVRGTLKAKGLPQILSLDTVIGEKYFSEFGEPALPPYIQRARNERRARPQDRQWYQSAWAEATGSAAAPTASLHFSEEDLSALRARGVVVAPVTLHVGLGTFLPVKTENLVDHQMHAEQIRIPARTLEAVTAAQAGGYRVWALGTTALRSVEAWANGDLKKQEDGGYDGSTCLFIRPGYEFKVVRGLLTNFHQPESTLLALVMAFAGRGATLRLYDWAIANKFRLFSYGDLTVWTR